MGDVLITPPPKGFATFKPQGSSSKIIAAIQALGLAGWTETDFTPDKTSYSPFPTGFQPSWSMRMAAYANYQYVDPAAQTPPTMNLLLLAGGTLETGLMVYKIDESTGGVPGFTLLSVIPLGASAYDVALDTRRHIAYVACYDKGVAVVDMSNPYVNQATPFTKLDKNGDGIDDRILGYVLNSGGSRATLVVDSETGLLYIGDMGTTRGMKIVGAQNPRIEFLLDDPKNPNQFLLPGYLNAFENDKPRLGLWMPGGDIVTGRSLSANLDLYDRKGFHEETAKDSSGASAPSTTVSRQVFLDRVSNKKTEAKYNFYIQRADTPNVVQLAMNYNASESSSGYFYGLDVVDVDLAKTDTPKLIVNTPVGKALHDISVRNGYGYLAADSSLIIMNLFTESSLVAYLSASPPFPNRLAISPPFPKGDQGGFSLKERLGFNFFDRGW